jgi:hypothetical protein
MINLSTEKSEEETKGVKKSENPNAVNIKQYQTLIQN